MGGRVTRDLFYSREIMATRQVRGKQILSCQVMSLAQIEGKWLVRCTGLGNNSCQFHANSRV